MEKLKKLRISIVAVLLALAVACASLALLLTRPLSVAYADRYVELDGNTVFYTAIQGAQIVESDPIKLDEAQEESSRYTEFRIGKEEKVEYRKNLAYSWKTGEKEDGSEVLQPVDNTFSMKFSFKNTDFKRYIITFQSQQYVLTEEGVTTNYLIFEPVNSGANIRVKLAQSLEENEDHEIKECETVETAFDAGYVFEIGFGKFSEGNYPLTIGGIEMTQVSFKNVYEHYATYVSTGDNAVMPLTFSVQFADGASEEAEAQMILYTLNGQSFEMFENGGAWKVKDNVEPVICFKKTPSYVEYGKALSFDYEVIDVLASSPRANAYYYVLKGTQYEKFLSGEFDCNKTDYEEKKDETAEGGEDGGETAAKEESPFIQISSVSSIRIMRDEDSFIPREYLEDGSVYGLVKIYYEVYDYSGSAGNKDIVFVDWHAKEGSLYNLNGDENAGFLKLIDNKKGVTYANGAETLTAYKESVKAFQQAYQQKITDAIGDLTYDKDSGLENGKLYAGSDKKFYLPAIDFEFDDEYLTARDYKYSIYYNAKTKGSSTSLDPNKLAINLTEADVTYRFTILITDAFGNSMRYPDGSDEETGEVIWKEITSSDVWDEDFAELLPYFEFDVSYKEASSKDPEDLSLSYVGTSYSGISFKIDGVTDTYTTEYNLYVFNRKAYNKDTGKSLENVDDFISQVKDLMANEDTRSYFTTVKASSNLLETDPNYEKFRALNWNSTVVSFTPQSIDDFYVVELTLTDNRSLLQSRNYAAVAASVQTTSLKGESDWLENNKTSVILLSISGVCLIALIVLLVVKPKDKGDIDAIYSEVEEKGKKGKKQK